MKIMSSEEFAKMSVVQRWQHYLRRKYQEVENSYYPHVEELVQKLEDLGEIHPDYIPDFTIHTFSFIKEWQYGEVNTAFVLGILSGMNVQSVAEKQITRRLQNFMQGREKTCPQSCEYIKAVIDQLTVKTVPLYQKYLEMLVKYFNKMYEIDRAQVRLSWIEQIFNSNGEVTVQAREITLNQMFRELDATIIRRNEHKYVIGENVVIFDEDPGNENTVVHWIFGPKSYIKILKEQFAVTESMSLVNEKDYLKRLIGACIK